MTFVFRETGICPKEKSMRKSVLAAAIATLILGASTAIAAEATATITSIDPSKDTVVLDNGSTYTASPTVKLSDFKVGQKVTVNYTPNNGKLMLTTMKPAS
jgi:Cu/Ag efflux protein CusF